MTYRTGCAALLLVLALGPAPRARGEPVEPPPDVADGEDYEAEIPDSVATGSIETSLGATGGSAGRARGRRRVRFEDGALAGDVRDGADDPLAGGEVEARGGSGRWTVGRLGVAWGRGLVLGASGEPWRIAPGAARAPSRRAGQGLRWTPGPGLELLGGRFPGGEVAGLRAAHSGVALGALADRGGRAAASLGLERESVLAELALDLAGRWRGEVELRRALARARLALRARGGDEGFRGLADPRLVGPARLLAAGLASAPPGNTRGEAPGLGARVTGALWRFRPGVTGARATLELSARMAHHGRLAAGWEERRGVRRAPAEGGSGLLPDPWRQGVWYEWRVGGAGASLGLGQELWGARVRAGEATRSVSTASLALRGPAGSAWRIVHAVHRARRGERLYLAESEADRVVLRALAGDGERTRVEARAPFAGGTAQASASLAAAPGRAARWQWTTSWTRRAAIRRARSP